MTADHKLPIAENFHSIQGEGQWVGTPMHFIRLAGCPVGKTATKTYLEGVKDEFGIAASDEMLPVINNQLSACRTYDGRYFPCDTDFKCHSYKSTEELLLETHEHHICLTGGEPLIHQRKLIDEGFLAEIYKRQILVHVETSGTVLLDGWFLPNRLWLTVAPKFDFHEEMIRRADEVKILIDDDFDITNLPESIRQHPNVFLSPINGEKEVNHHNVARAIKLLEQFPHWRLSCQWHKFLGLR